MHSHRFLSLFRIKIILNNEKRKAYSGNYHGRFVLIREKWGHFPRDKQKQSLKLTAHTIVTKTTITSPIKF